MNLFSKLLAVSVLALSLTSNAGKSIPPYRVKGSGIKAPGGATGFFRTEKVNGRWFFVDPNGEMFFGAGIDWVNGKGFNKAYNKNILKKYGSIEKWSDETVRRLKSWGVNTLGTSNTPQLRYKGLPYSHCANIGSRALRGFPKDKQKWKKMPNVFHPDWEKGCLKYGRKLAKIYKPDDTWFFGYYLDNELQWYGRNKSEYGIFDDTMAFDPDHSAKVALKDILAKHHGSVAGFNAAWKEQIKDWNDILKLKKLTPKTEKARKGQIAFLREVAERYFRGTTAGLRAVDKNHLILGSRFAGNAPAWVWEACAKYCDVVSFNNYPAVDIESGDTSEAVTLFNAYHNLLGRDKPMMLTEWSFPSYDSGLPCKKGAGMRVDTQAERARAAELLHYTMAELPYMAGSNFFMWVDEPAKGFGEDCNYGLVNEKDEPYAPITSMFAKLNPAMTAIHLGRKGAYDLKRKGAVSTAASAMPWPRDAVERRSVTLNAPKKLSHPLPFFTDTPSGFGKGFYRAETSTGKNLCAGGMNPTLLLVPELPAKKSTFIQVYPEKANAKKSSVKIDRKGQDSFCIDNGVIRLERDRDSGKIIDRIYLGKKLLGGCQTMLWQAVGFDRESWKGADSTSVLNINVCGDIVQIDLASSGTAGEKDNKVDFTIVSRLSVWPGSPAFAVRILKISNSGIRNVLRLRGSFIQLLPDAGGDKGELKLKKLDKVPYWKESKSGLIFGAVAAPAVKRSKVNFSPSLSPDDVEVDAYSNIWGLFTLSNVFKVNFWGSKKSGFHADAFVRFAGIVNLVPGKTYCPRYGADLVIFGADQSRNKPESWDVFSAGLLEYRKASVRCGKVEKR